GSVAEVRVVAELGVVLGVARVVAAAALGDVRLLESELDVLEEGVDLGVLAARGQLGPVVGLAGPDEVADGAGRRQEEDAAEEEGHRALLLVGALQLLLGDRAPVLLAVALGGLGELAERR